LVLGGARSGKSAFAERLAAECGEPVLYIATAWRTDDEMAERIARHRAQRSPAWLTVETPRSLVDHVDRAVTTTVVVEDLTLLLSNHMEVCPDDAEAQALNEVESLLALELNVILVSNEVGMGLVPAYPLGRAFRDALGRVNQHAAQLCDEVYLTVAGLPLRLK
jgi:adenosylcobinamide kinase/adenosylcobinamide-phosphate guanylyltransferase